MTLNQGNKVDVVGEAVLNEQDAVELVELQVLFCGVGGLRNGSLRGGIEKGGAEDRRLKVRWAGSRQVLIAVDYCLFKERHGVPRGAGDQERGAICRNFLRRGADEERKA